MHIKLLSWIFFPGFLLFMVRRSKLTKLRREGSCPQVADVFLPPAVMSTGCSPVVLPALRKLIIGTERLETE